MAGLAGVVLLIGVAVALLRMPSQDQPAARPPSGTFVASVPGGRALLWAVGDGADGGRDAKAVTEMIRSWGVDRLLYLSDVYDSVGISGALTAEGGAAAVVGPVRPCRAGRQRHDRDMQRLRHRRAHGVRLRGGWSQPLRVARRPPAGVLRRHARWRAAHRTAPPRRSLLRRLRG